MLVPLFAVLFGACIGSFLNVCIYRLPLGQSLVWPGSRCTSCGRALSWYDNLPDPELGHARRTMPDMPCAGVRDVSDRGGRDGARVSRRLPAVRPYAARRSCASLFACALIVLFVTDLQHKILPNIITLPGIVIGFVCSLFLPPGLA